MAERWSIWGSLLAIVALCAGCDGRVEQSERLNWALSQPALVAVLSPYPPGTHFNRAIEDGLRRCHVNAQAIDAIPTGTPYSGLQYQRPAR